MEILEDAPEADTIICGIGGGGLISGVAAAVKRAKPSARVIGVEPTGAPGMTLALEAGAPVRLESLDTVADGLAAPFVGAHNLNHVRAFVDEVVTVEDADIIEATWLILERAKVFVGTGGVRDGGGAAERQGRNKGGGERGLRTKRGECG